MIFSLETNTMFDDEPRQHSVDITDSFKILKTASNSELFKDEIGEYFVDTQGRKLYVKPNDDTHYQLNEDGVLVKLNDEPGRPFYYDRCGRYYLDEQHERVYQASPNASEYMLDTDGNMCKTMEIIDGVEYRYNEYGRYVLDADGKRIYKDDQDRDLEEDELGNLVRPVHQRARPSICVEDLIMKGESEYLQANMGKALRECLARTVIMQPPYPIRFLSECLRKYKEMNIKLDEFRAQAKELEIQREIVENEEREERERQEALNRLQKNAEWSYGSSSEYARAEVSTVREGEDEVSTVDTNMLTYGSSAEN